MNSVQNVNDMIITGYTCRKRAQKCSGHDLRMNCAGPSKSCHGNSESAGDSPEQQCNVSGMDENAAGGSCGEITLTSQNEKQEQFKKEENGYVTERDAVLQTTFPLRDIVFSCTGNWPVGFASQRGITVRNPGERTAPVYHGGTSGRPGNRTAEHRRRERRRWGRC